MTSVQFFKPCLDNATQVWQNFRQVARQKCPQSPDKPHTLSAAAVKPVKPVPVGRQIESHIRHTVLLLSPTPKAYIAWQAHQIWTIIETKYRICRSESRPKDWL